VELDYCISSIESDACVDYCLGLIGNKSVTCFAFERGCKARYNPETQICELTSRQKNGEIKMGRLSLTASAANVTPANDNQVGAKLNTIEKLVTERFATSQKMIWNNGKAIEALALEVALIKASVKEIRNSLENLTAAISIHAAVNTPATIAPAKPIESAKTKTNNNGNALVDLINNATDHATLRAIARDNKPMFEEIAIARNISQWSAARIAAELAATKTNMLSKLTATPATAKAPETVKESPMETWSKQLKLDAGKLKILIDTLRKEGYPNVDAEEDIASYLSHDNLPAPFFNWLKSVAEPVRK
jgi:hypothetical protein